eukprot:TRINITY_DN15759_c0_g1_i1.p1 TRINITY_DN15759_c0_g1~~TRINITY_DN15759_c0_g1_i1.p1  ORF type:complete len:374 (+),score=55.36 TRINITY_DN15759_c0_g1_i1:16-1137(+)
MASNVTWPSVQTASTAPGLPSADWPAPTAAASHASWPSGHQPQRLEGWTKNSNGVPAPCWKVTVLHDSKQGWPGRCLNLFQIDTVTSESKCNTVCWGDARCSVWQFMNQTSPGQCWIGYGTDCDMRNFASSSASVVAAQRLQHGSVRVLKQILGTKVNNLFQIGFFKEGSQALSITRCRDWCYSNIACEYWQYSTTGGCFVDAPMLGRKGDKTVQYPLTTNGGVSANAQDMIAGEYLQHYCPPVEGDQPVMRMRSVAEEPQTGPSIWLWLLGIAVVLALLAGAAFAYYKFVYQKRRTARSTVSRSLEDGQAQNLKLVTSEQDAKVAAQSMQPMPTGYAQGHWGGSSGFQHKYSQLSTGHAMHGGGAFQWPVQG